ncbi:hypothetical protein CsSME_00022960 [Camellia sinensis var. sinensis]
MTSNDSPWRGGGSLTPMVIYCIISIQILSAPRSHTAAIRIAGKLRALFITDFCPIVEMESEHDFITFLIKRLHSDPEQNKQIAHTLTLHARAFKMVISFCGRRTTNCLGHVALVTKLVKRLKSIDLILCARFDLIWVVDVNL